MGLLFLAVAGCGVIYAGTAENEPVIEESTAQMASYTPPPAGAEATRIAELNRRALAGL